MLLVLARMAVVPVEPDDPFQIEHLRILPSYTNNAGVPFGGVADAFLDASNYGEIRIFGSGSMNVRVKLAAR